MEILGSDACKISFADFNIIDPMFIHEKLGKPVIVISRTEPGSRALNRALQRHFEDRRVRWDVCEKSGLKSKVVIFCR